MMLASSFLLLVLPIASAQIMPTTPGPNETYAAGSACKIAWTPDSSGSWMNMTIDLMSGSNSNMTLVTTVASALDGTNTSLTPFSWTCPEVTPYSAIYFYQFTNGNQTANSTWTTRFTISSPSNETEPPSSSAQPNGDLVPWGTGTLAGKEAVLRSNSTSSVSEGRTSSEGSKEKTKSIASTSTGKSSQATDSPVESDSQSTSKHHDKHHHETRSKGDEDGDSTSAHEAKKHIETAALPVDDSTHTAGSHAESGTHSQKPRSSDAAQKDSPFFSSESGSPGDCHCEENGALALDHSPASFFHLHLQLAMSALTWCLVIIL